MNKMKRVLTLLLLVACISWAGVAQAATCTVNNGLINPPNSNIQLNGVDGVPGLVIGVGKPSGSNAGVVYVNGVASTLPAGTNQLNAVSVASTSYAVAVGENGGVVQYNAGVWTSLATPLITQDLKGVNSYGPNQTYVVGKQGIFFYNGTTWTQQSTVVDFEGIWGDATSVYAVTNTGAVYKNPPTAWTLLTAAACPAGGGFKEITGDGVGNLYLVGKDAAGGGFISKISATTGACLTGFPVTTTQEMKGVAVNPTTGAITAVGKNGAVATVAANGTGLTQTTAGTNDINGVYISPSGTTYMAGQTSAGCTAVAAPDHLEIQHGSGTGLTCAASTLAVRACADAACTTPYTGGVSGTLSATGTPTVNWDGATGGATGAGFVIPGGSSSVTKNVQVATAGSVVFGITSPSPAPTNATTCNFGAPTCTFTASTAGFIFSNSTIGNTYTIPAQVAGIATPTLYLRAVQASTANPAVCTPAIVGQTTAVNMGYACNNPATCQAGNLVTINTTAIAGSPNATPTQNSTAVNLTFDTNGSTPITVRYDDVGQITLYANKTVTPFGGATPITLNGNSNSFVVAPHHFGLSGITAGPVKAGNNFSATVTAYNGLATPTATPNFGKETTPESATITFSKCQPTGTGSSNGAFSGSVGTFASGVATATNLNWSEVGNGDLTATNSNYLASGFSATGNTGTGGTVCNTVGNVGPFIPDHFVTAVTDGCAGCGFTYSGQSFTATITAKNGLATPTTTVNYDGSANTTPNFANNVSLTDANAAATPVGKLGVSAAPMGVTANAAGTILTVPKADFAAGMATLNSVPLYTFNAVATAPTTIKIRSVDSLNAAVTSSGFAEGTTQIRSGRVKISNAHGSELLPLPLTATVQYCGSVTGGNCIWLTSATDSATAFNTATDIVATIIKGPLAAGNISVAGAGAVTVLGGVKTFTLNKPGVTGSADISLSAPSYLLAGSNGAAANPSIAGRATFGVYKGANEFIYMRESY